MLVMSAFEFSNYTAFLRSWIEALPRKGRGEINRMAEHLRVHASLISQVLNGSKHFTAEQIHSLCRYMGLSSLESDYLILLVQAERAGTHAYKIYCERKIEEIKKAANQVSNRLSDHRSLSDSERTIFYSSWIYSAVRLFTSLGDGKTVDDVSRRFALDRDRAVEILQFLKKTQLCIEEAGLFKMGTQHTHVEFGSPFLARHHTNWRLRGMIKCENLSRSELMFTAPFSISKKDFSRVREEIMRTIERVSKTIKDSPADEVACLNIDLFWIEG